MSEHECIWVCVYIYECIFLCSHTHSEALDDCLGVYSSLFLCPCDKITWAKHIIEERLSLFYGPTGRMSKMSWKSLHGGRSWKLVDHAFSHI